MEFRRYWHVLRRRAWIPLLLVAVTVLTAGLLTLVRPPQYTATATVIAKGGGADKTLSFTEVAISNSLALRVLHQLDLQESVNDLTGRIKVSSGRSNLYKVSVTDRSADRAAALANAVAKEAAVLYQELAGGTRSSIVKDLEKDRKAFRDQYLAATKALMEFNRQHPDAAGPTADITAQAQLLQLDERAAADAYQRFPGARTREEYLSAARRFLQFKQEHPDAGPGSDAAAQARLLQLDEKAAADSYLRFEQEVTRARADELTNARNFAASVVDEAAARPDTMARLLDIIYAASVALILGVGLSFALEYLADTVRDPEEAEQLLGAPVLGTIPRASARRLHRAARAAR